WATPRIPCCNIWRKAPAWPRRTRSGSPTRPERTQTICLRRSAPMCSSVTCAPRACRSWRASTATSTMRAGRQRSCAIKCSARARRSRLTTALLGSTARCDPLSGACCPATTASLLQPRDRARLTGQLQNMHAGIGAIDHVDVAAVVGFHVVALDRGLAAVHSIDLDAAFGGWFRDRRDEGAGLLRVVRVGAGGRAHPGIEVGDEGDLLVRRRRHALIGGMRAEAAPTLAEISARLGHREI